jgi:hypothetical protein
VNHSEPAGARLDGADCSNARLAWAGLTLVAVFAAYNLEEVSGGGPAGPPAFVGAGRVRPPAGLYRLDRFALATVWLTVAVAALFSPSLSGRPPTTRRTALRVAAAGALGGNAVGHLALALVSRRRNPGVVTAPALLVAAVAAATADRRSAGLPGRTTGLAVGAGLVATVPIIGLALGAARLLRP